MSRWPRADGGDADGVEHELEATGRRLAGVVAEVDRLLAALRERELADRLPAVDRRLIEDGALRGGAGDDVVGLLRLRVRRVGVGLDLVRAGRGEDQVPRREVRLARLVGGVGPRQVAAVAGTGDVVQVQRRAAVLVTRVAVVDDEAAL